MTKSIDQRWLAAVALASGTRRGDARFRRCLVRTHQPLGAIEPLHPPFADLLETTEESYDYVVGTNLRGVFFLTQAFARDMVAARKADPKFAACIINITSISATVVSINRGEYCIAKAGLSMLSQLFATRLGPDGIPVYEVRPGVIKTDMTAGVTDKYDKLIAGGLNIQPRWGYPEDVGKAVASLARGDFPFSTRQVFMVDGGLTIPRL